jgi:hypothetical protein
MTTQMNLINKIIACKSILLMSLFFSAPHALAQSVGDSVSATSDDGATTYYANQNSNVSGEYGYSISQLSSAVADAETNEWMTGSQVRTDNMYDADTDTTDARVTLGAAASSFCTGGGNDQCGAQISMRQTAVGGVNNGSTIDMSAATVRINGNVSLGSVGDNGSYVGDLAAYVTSNRATAQANVTAIATNTAGVATNAAGVATNVTAIATNAAGVAANVTAIATNAAGVAANVTAIATNAAGVAANVTAIATNAAGVATNAAGVAANVATLAVHEGLVTQNIADIAINADGVAANVATLAAHNTAIGTNMASIGNLQSSFANFQTETMDNFARMGSDMHRGLAEVTALSNVAYADKGWRASVGYGDYESKSAAAVGISYAGERFKFKVSRSGKATGAGIAFDF